MSQNERISHEEVASLIAGFEQEKWRAVGPRVVKMHEGDAETIVDLEGFRDPECDARVAKIMAAAPRALLTLDALHAECVAWRERAVAAEAKIARYVSALDEREAVTAIRPLTHAAETDRNRRTNELTAEVAAARDALRAEYERVKR